MLALAALPFIIFLVLLALVLLCFGKWRSALVLLCLAVSVNVYSGQIPLNPWIAVRSLFNSCNCKDSGPESGRRVKKIRIFEYNVCARSEYSSRHDRNFIDYILAQNADILFLPENLYYTDKALDSVLNEHYSYSVYRQMSKKERPEEMGIYSRYPLEGIKRLEINGVKSNSLISATAIIDGRTVGLIFAHCSSNRNGLSRAYESRRAEAEVLVNELKSTFADATYIILAGDLNDVNGSPLLKTLGNAGLRDAWWEAGCGPGFTYVNSWLRFRLDHIMVGGTIAVENIELDSKAAWSDHKPLVADIELLDF